VSGVAYGESHTLIASLHCLFPPPPLPPPSAINHRRPVPEHADVRFELELLEFGNGQAVTQDGLVRLLLITRGYSPNSYPTPARLPPAPTSGYPTPALLPALMVIIGVGRRVSTIRTRTLHAATRCARAGVCRAGRTGVRATCACSGLGVGGSGDRWGVGVCERAWPRRCPFTLPDSVLCASSPLLRRC